MPAEAYTRKATTDKLRRQWEHVRQSELNRGASRKDAIIRANGVVKKMSRGKSHRSKRRSRRS